MNERDFLINMIILMYNELASFIELEFQCSVTEYVNEHMVKDDDLKMALMVAKSLAEDKEGE